MPPSHFPLTRLARQIGGSGRRDRTSLVGATVLCLSLGLVGCDRLSSGRPETHSTTDAAAVVAATAPTTVPSTFCAAIDSLKEFRQDSTEDYAAQAERIASIYEGLLDDLPEAVRPDFEVVIATLRANAAQPGGATQSDIVSTPEDSTLPPSDESGYADESGYVVDATPVERVNNYITYTCTGVGNNPGPAPTTPP